MMMHRASENLIHQQQMMRKREVFPPVQYHSYILRRIKHEVREIDLSSPMFTFSLHWQPHIVIFDMSLFEPF